MVRLKSEGVVNCSFIPFEKSFILKAGVLRLHMKIVTATLVRLVPALILIVLLPFAVSFDSIMYWLTRPSCLNCGSLMGFLQTHSMTAGVVAGLVGHVKIGGYSFGRKK